MAKAEAENNNGSGYGGKLDTPGLLGFEGAGSGTFTLTGAGQTPWLEVIYLAGDNPLKIQVGGKQGETIMLYPSSAETTIVFNVKKPEDGVSISYQGKAKLSWEWMADDKAG